MNCKDLSYHDVTTKLFKKNPSFYPYSLRSFGDFTTAAILILCVTLAAGQVDHRSTRRTRSQGLSSVQHGGDSSNSKLRAILAYYTGYFPRLIKGLLV